MDNSQGAELKREALMKVLIGDEIGTTMLTTLLQFGLIRKRSIKAKGMDAWILGPTSNYELTQKGLDRLNGI